LISAAKFLQPLNHSVVFWKAKDVIFTSDIRCVAINLDLNPYEEVIAKIQDDLLVVQRQKN
jgi:hypothetical protein